MAKPSYALATKTILSVSKRRSAKAMWSSSLPVLHIDCSKTSREDSRWLDAIQVVVVGIWRTVKTGGRNALRVSSGWGGLKRIRFTVMVDLLSVFDVFEKAW